MKFDHGWGDVIEKQEAYRGTAEIDKSGDLVWSWKMNVAENAEVYVAGGALQRQVCHGPLTFRDNKCAA